MRRLKIALDPRLKRAYGPEICWTWRLLLTGIGVAWEEVAPDGAPCDIAYAADPGAVPSRLCVRADERLWERRAGLRLESVDDCGGWPELLYKGEPRPAGFFHSAAGGLVCERDIVFDIFWLVTGQEERAWPQNRHGHYDLGGAGAGWRDALRRAPASALGARLEKTFVELGFPPAAPRWPRGKRAAVAASHDVDYPEAVRWLEPLRVLGRLGWPGLAAATAVAAGKKHHWHFFSWIEMERRLEYTSAFYFTARRGSLLEYAAGTPDSFYDVGSDRFKELFRRLSDAGVEIGLQASYRACESGEKLAAEKSALEAASGLRIAGNRHHYWRLDPADPEATLGAHERAGLRYDTSLAHDRYLGWRRGISWPFFPFSQKERRELKTLQIPTAWMDGQLFARRRDDPDGGPAALGTLADTARAQAGCLLIDVHEYVFDDALFPGWKNTYGGLMESLVRRGDFWIESPGKIAEHWMARHAAIARASRGLTGEADA